MNQELVKDCETLGMMIDQLDDYQVRDVISCYRKKIRQTHPDKCANASEEEKKIKTAECQKLNKAYERVLKYIIEKSKDRKCSDDDDEKFLKAILGNSIFQKKIMVVLQ